jgi:hypothetical protein
MELEKELEEFQRTFENDQILEIKFIVKKLYSFSSFFTQVWFYILIIFLTMDFLKS